MGCRAAVYSGASSKENRPGCWTRGSEVACLHSAASLEKELPDERVHERHQPASLTANQIRVM
jgi:hypothetical protein